MFAIIVIVLLVLIAIGVLMMTEGGKAILGGIGSLAIIGAILFVLFWIVVLGYMFFHSSVVDMLKFFLQLGWEIKVLDNSKYVALSEPLDEVGRMLGGWLRQVTLPPENNSRAAVK